MWEYSSKASRAVSVTKFRSSSGLCPAADLTEPPHHPQSSSLQLTKYGPSTYPVSHKPFTQRTANTKKRERLFPRGPGALAMSGHKFRASVKTLL